jgi:hypothetical protein
MRTLMTTLAFTALALTVDAQPTRAEVTYPWCAEGSFKDGARTCGFVSFAQCMASISGRGASYCAQNPMYRPGVEERSRRPRR